ncbi:alpha/beta hydrolase [Nocardioides limicola]|uniref:alpha/beta hydrolase n=1 Tax=Nocardioides limicola TaxID=2803368 RepID=UPI00193AE6AA|nr:alpha/beta hydrolase [Nocardioides sp. DJM-14]
MEIIRFPSGETECAGWVFRPDQATSPAPAIVLGHGLGAVKEMGLAAYAERFAAAGFVCVVFDYRHFGESGGEPRQLLDIGRQREDWKAALEFTRSLPGVDPDRVSIFGTSFGGGHVIATAAADPRVKSVIAQCPFTDGIASAFTVAPRTVPRMMGRVLHDQLRRLTGKSPVMLPLAGNPRTAALMNAPDVIPGYLGLVPDGLDFRNEVAARVGLQIMTNRPGRLAKKVHCPMLVALCETDTVAPARATERLLTKAPKVRIQRYPIGHFDIYTGEWFERAVADYLRFLDRWAR